MLSIHDAQGHHVSLHSTTMSEGYFMQENQCHFMSSTQFQPTPFPNQQHFMVEIEIMMARQHYIAYITIMHCGCIRNADIMQLYSSMTTHSRNHTEYESYSIWIRALPQIHMQKEEEEAFMKNIEKKKKKKKKRSREKK